MQRAARQKVLSRADAEAFLRQAQERWLGEFLVNPQNLQMLSDVVQGGRWPTTRTELFERSTEVMLQEFDRERARRGGGVYSAAELRPVAGAVCAAGLISDVEAISLSDQEGTPQIPSYREPNPIRYGKNASSARAARLRGRPAPESAYYAHRTTAEYLGAAWLARAIRNGLPFGRLQALIGVDGHPAPELRGLTPG